MRDTLISGLAAILLALSAAGCSDSTGSAASSAANTADVDPVLVGIWRLQWPGPAIIWEIRADGTYEIGGPGAGPGHKGSFQASAGKWSLQSATWGVDGGDYRLTGPDIFTGNGRLGAGTWIREGSPPVQASTPAAPLLSTEPDSSRPLPKDIPELVQAATERARTWRQDAIPISIDFRHWDAPNLKGPEVRISFFSRSTNAGLRLTVTTGDVRSQEFNQTAPADQTALPVVFLDLPAALRIARSNGLRGALDSASLRFYKPGSEAILAWMVHGGTAGRTVDAASGQIIEGDVTGYISSYNAEWDKAIRGLRALIAASRPRPSGGPSLFDFPSPGSSSSSDQPQAGGYTQEDYQRDAAEGRAYWGGSAEDYDRVKRGECTWSDSSRFGC